MQLQDSISLMPDSRKSQHGSHLPPEISGRLSRIPSIPHV